MVSKVRITKPLQKYFNNLDSIELDADSYYNLYSNMVNLFKDFRQVSLELGTNKYADLWFVVDGHLLPTDQIFFPVKKGAEISDRKSTRLNSSHSQQSRMPSSA